MPRRTKGSASKPSQGKPRGKAVASSTAPAKLEAPSRPSSPAAARPADQAIRLPQPPKESSYYRSAVVFAGGVMVIAILLYAVIREAGTGRVPSAPPEVEDPLFEEVRRRDEFKDWVSKWRTADPYVSAAEFTMEARGPIVPARPADMVPQPGPDDLVPPKANRYVWSPDHSRYVDYLASFGEPDSTLDLFGRLDGRLETLAFCGTPCHFDGAFWLDADRVAVLGRTEGLKQDGTPLCLPEGAGGELRCYERLTLAIYDLSANERVGYRSENHLFGTNPYGPLAEERWMTGLSAEERAAMGRGSARDIETITGPIIDITADARILTIGGGRVPRFLAVSDTAEITDERGAVVPFESLLAGFIVEARAVRQPDGTSLAAFVRIVTSPNIIVDQPVDGTEVGLRVLVSGLARTFESNVQLRLVNERTGKILAEKFTTALTEEAGTYGTFAFDFRLSPTSVKAGDQLTLELYDTSAESGAEIDVVIIRLVYRP